jgi:hypothetical protein
VDRLDLSLEDTLVRSNGPVSVAVDASGVKVHNSGDWIRKVWKVRKGYLKIHFAVNIKTKQIVALNVSSEKVHDGRRLKGLVKEASENFRVKRVLADGAYDSREHLPLRQQHQAIDQGEKQLRSEEQRMPAEKECCDGAEDVQTQSVEQNTQVRL